ncbi:albusnodin/ikarugamycin family macrolactam cyclase [Actinophytocola sediminis]
MTAGQPSRVVRSGDVTMVVLGHCLASDAELTDSVRTMSATRRLDPAAAGWPGCYSLAVLLPHELLLLTDPVGQFPWYAAAAPGGRWFGSSPIELAGRARAGVDRGQLAMTIACDDVLGFADGGTEFSGVRGLAPGVLLTGNSTGISTTTYGALIVGAETSVADAAERLRLSLLRSVEARAGVGRMITGDFSGGIDSSALMFLALRTGAEVSGFTFQHSAAEDEDDLVWARHFAGHAPGLAHRLVPSTDEELPYQKLSAPGEQPHPAAMAAGPLRARLRLAAEHGSTLHLVGEGGDVVLGAPPAYLADLARQHEWAALWRHCLRWARIRQCSPLLLLRRALAVATSRRQALRALAAAILRAAPAEGRPPWDVGAIAYWDAPRGWWLTRGARSDLADHVRTMADDSPADPADHVGVADAVTMSQLRTQILTERAVRAVGGEFGVEVHAPYLDSEVVRACLALPAWRRADPAVAKPLLRAALTGLVPDTVLTRPTKGNYARSAFVGVRRAAPALRALLADSTAADHGLLDPVPVRAVLERAIQGLPTPWRALNQVFAVELWLRDVSAKVVG